MPAATVAVAAAKRNHGGWRRAPASFLIFTLTPSDRACTLYSRTVLAEAARSEYGQSAAILRPCASARDDDCHSRPVEESSTPDRSRDRPTDAAVDGSAIAYARGASTGAAAARIEALAGRQGAAPARWFRATAAGFFDPSSSIVFFTVRLTVLSSTLVASMSSERAPDPPAGRHRGDEPHLVRPVVDRHLRVLDAVVVLGERRDHRQRQEAVRNRSGRKGFRSWRARRRCGSTGDLLSHPRRR